jgi:hypothetical protein
VFQIVGMIFMRAMNIQPDAYTSGFLNTAPLWGHPLQVATNALADMASVYAGSAAIFGVPISAMIIVYVVGIAALAMLKIGVVQKLVMALLLLSMFGAHLGLELVTNNTSPLRAFVAAPFAVAIFVALALRWSGPVLKLVLLGSLAVVLFQLLVFAGHFDAAGRLRRQHDLALATEVYARVMQANPLKTHRDRVVVEFHGPKAFESPYKVPESGNSASFFEWDAGNPWRMVLFMRLIGFVNLDLPSDEQRAALEGAFAPMPNWPAEGSVTVVDGVTLVKFGP